MQVRLLAGRFHRTPANLTQSNSHPTPHIPPTLSNEHHWLNRLVGDWTYETEAIPVPGEPSIKDGGTEHVRSLDGVWIVCEGHGAMPDGGMATTLMTIGYDAAKARCVGTFVGTMMTTLWVTKARWTRPPIR